MNSISIAGFLGSTLDPIILLITFFIAKYLVSKNYPLPAIVSITLILIALVSETISAKADGQVWGDEIIYHAMVATVQAIVMTLILWRVHHKAKKAEE